MSEIDLNIDNYSLDDLLSLFKISDNLTDQDMKIAKQTTLKMHPDKSGLDKRYFLFFSEAYKLLYQLYVFQDKSRENDTRQNTDYQNYKIDLDDSNLEILNKLNNNKHFKTNFNKWFNREFEKMKLTDDFTEGGYGDWLQSDKDIQKDQICTSQNMIHEKIMEKKHELTSLIQHNEIREFNNLNHSDLTNSRPQEYSSDPFSKLQYEDLKKAHTETVVPVVEEDSKKRYNLEELREIRGQTIIPLTEKDSREKILNDKKIDNRVNTEQVFRLARQQQMIERRSINWWGKLKHLR